MTFAKQVGLDKFRRSLLDLEPVDRNRLTFYLILLGVLAAFSACCLFAWVGFVLYARPWRGHSVWLARNLTPGEVARLTKEEDHV